MTDAQPNQVANVQRLILDYGFLRTTRHAKTKRASTKQLDQAKSGAKAHVKKRYRPPAKSYRPPRGTLPCRLCRRGRLLRRGPRLGYGCWQLLLPLGAPEAQVLGRLRRGDDAEALPQRLQVLL